MKKLLILLLLTITTIIASCDKTALDDFVSEKLSSETESGNSEIEESDTADTAGSPPITPKTKKATGKVAKNNVPAKDAPQVEAEAEEVMVAGLNPNQPADGPDALDVPADNPDAAGDGPDAPIVAELSPEEQAAAARKLQLDSNIETADNQIDRINDAMALTLADIVAYQQDLVAFAATQISQEITDFVTAGTPVVDAVAVEGDRIFQEFTQKAIAAQLLVAEATDLLERDVDAAEVKINDLWREAGNFQNDLDLIEAQFEIAATVLDEIYDALDDIKNEVGNDYVNEAGAASRDLRGQVAIARNLQNLGRGTIGDLNTEQERTDATAILDQVDIGANGLMQAYTMADAAAAELVEISNQLGIEDDPAEFTRLLRRAETLKGAVLAQSNNAQRFMQMINQKSGELNPFAEKARAARAQRQGN